MLPATARKNFHRSQSPGKSSTRGNRPVKFPQGATTHRTANRQDNPPPVPVMFQPIPRSPIRGKAERSQSNQRTRFIAQRLHCPHPARHRDRRPETPFPYLPEHFPVSGMTNLRIVLTRKECRGREKRYPKMQRQAQIACLHTESPEGNNMVVNDFHDINFT